jgi:hypothetical protein
MAKIVDNILLRSGVTPVDSGGRRAPFFCFPCNQPRSILERMDEPRVESCVEPEAIAGPDDLCRADEEEELSSRMKNARRAFRVVIIGLVPLPFQIYSPRLYSPIENVTLILEFVLLPLQFYAALLLFRVWTSREKLDVRGRRLAILATGINGCLLLFGGLVLLSFVAPGRPHQVNPLAFPRPSAMLGAWQQEGGDSELVLRSNGRFLFRQSVPELEFSGTWGIADYQFLIQIKGITKGGQSIERGLTFAWELDHFTEKELVLRDQVGKLRYVRPQK